MLICACIQMLMDFSRFLKWQNNQTNKQKNQKHLKLHWIEEKTSALRTKAFPQIAQIFSGSSLYYGIYFILKSIKSNQTFEDFLYCSSHLSGSVCLLHGSIVLFKCFGKALIIFKIKMKKVWGCRHFLPLLGKIKKKLLKCSLLN